MQGSWTRDRVRDFALALPGAHEGAHFGRADVRVRDRIFVTLSEDGRTANLKTTPIGLDMLLRADPETYRDAWGGRWVGVELARADAAELRELIVEAYCLAAPKSLAKGLRASPPVV